MKTVVGVNVLTSVNSMAYSSHCQEWFRMGRDFPTDDFILFNPHRMSIDRMRNEAVKLALELECEYLYFIDDDTILCPRTYQKLRDADKDVVMAHTIIRGYPFQQMMFIEESDRGFENTELNECTNLTHFNDYEDYIDEKTGLIRVDAIGCSTVLYKTSLFKDLEPPYFVTLPNCTEDVYCCMKMQRHFGRQKFQCYVHTGAPTGHILDPLIVSPGNYAKLKKRHEEDDPRILENALKIDRNDSYLGQVEELFK